MGTQFEKSSREEQLKILIRRLHDGASVADLKREFHYLLEHLSAEEIAAMEQSLVNEGFPVKSIQELCEIHVEVFEDSLKKHSEQAQPAGHPVETYKRENREAERRIKDIRTCLTGMRRRSGSEEYARLKSLAEDLRNYEKHYQRKENQLFPKLEAVGFTGPTNVMWGKHDEIRDAMKHFIAGIDAALVPKELKARFAAVSRKIGKMIFMEEKILFPTSMIKLSEKDWEQIRSEEPEIGYAWFDIPREAHPGTQKSRLQAAAEPVYNGEDEEDMMSKPIQIPLNEGYLTQQQLDLMLRVLPVDVTFVDEHDQVRYYSAADDRLFPRTPSIIGRDVQNCHPPKSVHIVQKIVESFRNKERDCAEFWIDFRGKKVHIRYFPVYDQSGAYRGTVEVSQDVTGIMQLEGERRLLDWE